MLPSLPRSDVEEQASFSDVNKSETAETWIPNIPAMFHLICNWITVSYRCHKAVQQNRCGYGVTTYLQITWGDNRINFYYTASAVASGAPQF